MKEEGKSDKENSFGIAAVILGILSVLTFFTIIFPIILGILGLIFALIQRKRNNNRWATAGIVLSIIGIILGVVLGFIAVKAVTEITMKVKTCMADPTLPGCEQFLQSAGYTPNQGTVLAGSNGGDYLS